MSSCVALHQPVGSFLWHSFLLYSLRRICNHYHAAKETDYSLSDLRGGSDMEKAKKFPLILVVTFLTTTP